MAAKTLDDIHDILSQLNSKVKGGSGFSGGGGSTGGGGGTGGGGFNFGSAVATTFSKVSDAITSIIRGASTGLGDLYSSGIVQVDQYNQERVAGGQRVFELLSKLGTREGFILSTLNEMYDQIIYQLEDEARLRTKINEETGLTGDLSEDVRRSILNASPAVLQMGYGMEQLSNFYTQMIENSGRFNIVNKQVLERTAQVSRAFVGDLSKMADHMSTFEKVGVGAADTLEYLNVIGVKSLELGLRSKKTVEDVTSNLERLNQYGFKNGIQGLAEMSRKATEFRMNMKNTFTIADKVFDPEGAIKLSAELSIIGGQLGAFNDPLKLMYMATNNVEGLQDALIDAAKGLATYNTEQGRFEVTGVNLRKAKAMADELGISVGELSKTAIAAAERTQAATALMSTGLQMNDEDREFLTNLSQMEKGEMVIRVPESLAAKLSIQMGQQIETAIPLSQMTESLKAELIRNKEAFGKTDAKDIALQQLSVQERIERSLMAISAVAKIRLTQALKDTSQPAITQMENIAARFGVAVENFTVNKGGKLSLIEGAEDIFKGVITKINENTDDSLTKANEMVTKYLEKVKVEQDKQSAGKTVIENRYTFGATPSLLDSLGRHIARSPQTWEHIYGAYSEDRKSYTYGGRSF